MAHQGVECVGHGALAAQQPQHHDTGVGCQRGNLTATSLSPWERPFGSAQDRVRVRAIGRVDGVNARETEGQRRQSAVCRQDVGVGGGDEQDGLLLHIALAGDAPTLTLLRRELYGGCLR